jgi:two-component system OmpR family sensor kinase
MFEHPRFKSIPMFDDLDDRVACWRLMLEAAREKTLDEWLAIMAADSNIWAEQFRTAPDLLHRPVDLLTVAADTVLDARAREPGRPVTVSQVHGEGWVDAAPVVSGDESRIRQVLGNVVANVLRHTPAGTPYEVMIGVREDTVEARVIDHGPGLTPEAATRVFERFFRNDYGRSRAHGGTGLGLSIAAGLMAAHGGSITHQDTPGGGSTFILSFRTGEPGTDPTEHRLDG